MGAVQKMNTSWDDDDEIDIKKIAYLYELRHACNVFGSKHVAKEAGIAADRVVSLCMSGVHGSEDLEQFLKLSCDEFAELVEAYEEEEAEYRQRIQAARERNDRLIDELKRKRKEFAGIGTNKAKRRLNKLALTDPVAKAIRLALEIEDRNVSAKKAYGTYRDKRYEQKEELILELCALFRLQGWVYGVQQSKVPPTSHVIYFEIPGCEQISWHFMAKEGAEGFPVYAGVWDNKPETTLEKLEEISARLLSNNH